MAASEIKQSQLKTMKIDWQVFWQRRGLLNFILLPFSILFYIAVALRRAFYRYGLFSSEKGTLPIVVIGNINAGGAGKTPLVIALGKILSEHDIKYAVISKGYGGSHQQPMAVDVDDCPTIVGDEPLLIKQRCLCPVVIAKSRIEAAVIVEEHYPEVTIILTDDGLQHYALQRDLEICVINHAMGLGNRWTLPAGGLREPVSRLKHVDFIVSNGDENSHYHYTLVNKGWYKINANEFRRPDEFPSGEKQTLALSGIAHPQQFFKRIQAMGIAATTKALPDHHAFSKDDLPNDKTLLMTEKDAVKVARWNHSDAWYLSLDAVISQPFQDDFLSAINLLIGETK